MGVVRKYTKAPDTTDENERARLREKVEQASSRRRLANEPLDAQLTTIRSQIRELKKELASMRRAKGKVEYVSNFRKKHLEEQQNRLKDDSNLAFVNFNRAAVNGQVKPL